MSLRDLVFDVGLLAAVAGAAFGGGYLRGAAVTMRGDNARVLAAQQGEQAAKDTLGKLQAQLAEQAKDVSSARQQAQQALDARDTAQAQLAAAQQRQQILDKATLHEDPDCAALVRMPVCPALSRRLFGEPAQAGSAAGTDAGH